MSPDAGRQSFEAPAPDQSSAPQPQSDQSGDSSVTWTASEFIAHEKNAGWYLSLALSAFAFSGLIYWITRDKVSMAVVLVAALFMGILAARKPRQLGYRIDATGVTIGEKVYPLDSFRSFSVVPEEAFSSIVFTPLRRFAPLTTIYYPPQEEEKIISMLTNRLPFEEFHHDPVDRFMRRIRL
jgi:hypothetical protein